MSNVIPLSRGRLRHRSQSDTSGLFWLLNQAEQQRRIRQLAASRLSIEQISTVCRMPLSQIRNIVEGAA